MRTSLIVCVLFTLASCDDTWFETGGHGGGGTTPTATEGWCAVQGLFRSQCVSCHSAGSAIGGLDLETDPHAALVGVTSPTYGAVLVEPGDPDGSLLYRKLAGTQAASEGGQMPPGGAVDADRLEAVRGWIADGASDTCDGPTGGTGTGTGRYHPEGWAEPGAHGLATKLQTETDCRTCHGEDLGGGAVGISCTSCHGEGWETTCTFCHGGVLDQTGAPPEDIDDESDPDAISFVPHPVHIESPLHATWDCTECHVKPTSALFPGHLFDDATPGRAEVMFAVGSYAAGTCSNLYCHGDGQGANGTIAVDAGPLGCDGCHPDARSDSGWGGMSGDHEDHLDEDFVCADCHPTADRSQQIVRPDLHVDGEVQLALPGTITRVGNTCTGSCHGEGHNGRNW